MDTTVVLRSRKTAREIKNMCIIISLQYMNVLIAVIKQIILISICLLVYFYVYSVIVEGEPREIQFWIANAKEASYFSLAVHGQSLFRFGIHFFTATMKMNLNESRMKYTERLYKKQKL